MPTTKHPPTVTTPSGETLVAAGWEAGAWLDRDWSERLAQMGQEAEQPPNVEPRLMALVALAVDAAPQSLYPQGIRRHIRRALAAGASTDEIAAVLRYVSLLGQHSMKLSASILMEELATHTHRQAKTPTRSPSHE